MKNTWNGYIALIESACVLKYANNNVVWYFDGAQGIFETRSGAMFPCNSWDEFDELYESIDEFSELD